MASIRTLLNPVPERKDKLLDETDDLQSQLASPTASYYDRNDSPTTPLTPSKKLKISKDQAVFVRGSIRGDCRYPPHEYQDEVLAAYHEKFEVYPMGEIAEYPRHIPYNSEKKLFLEKTGRECFEVFQYRFKVDDHVYNMLWDYNIGLVRTTPLFKCTGHSKTTPAKMLNRNPGLREICHSITGGALVAQGYWMPYEAAKAVAATFCWDIRHALTPVFGTDFPELCLPPEHDHFGQMLIDSDITIRCTEQARIYREIEIRNSSRTTSAMTSPVTPNTPLYPPHVKSMRHKALKIATSDSDYGSNDSQEDHYSLSQSPARAPYRTLWTPANTPRSYPRIQARLPTLREVVAGLEMKSRKRGPPSTSSSELSSPELSPKSRRVEKVDEAYDVDDSDDSSLEDRIVNCGRKLTPQYPGIANCGRSPMRGYAESDAKAARLLVSLRLQRPNDGAGVSKKRRASA